MGMKSKRKGRDIILVGKSWSDKFLEASEFSFQFNCFYGFLNWLVPFFIQFVLRKPLFQIVKQVINTLEVYSDIPIDQRVLQISNEMGVRHEIVADFLLAEFHLLKIGFGFFILGDLGTELLDEEGNGFDFFEEESFR